MFVQNVSEDIFIRQSASPGVDEWDRPFNICMTIIFAATGVIATVCNIALLYVIVWGRKNRRSPIKFLLIYLCICDLLISMVVIPHTLVTFTQTEMSVGIVMCKLFSFCVPVVMFASVFTLTAVSLQRSIGVQDVLRAQASSENRSRINRRCVKILFCVWFLAIICSVPLAIVSDVIPYQQPPQISKGNSTITITKKPDDRCVESWDLLIQYFKQGTITEDEKFIAKSTYSVLVLIILYVLPICFIGYAYFKICQLVMKSNKCLRTFSDSEIESLRNSSNNRFVKYRKKRRMHQLARSNRIFRLSVILVMIFILFWLPYHLSNLFMEFYSKFSTSHTEQIYKIFKDMYFVFMWLSLANSAANPVFLFATDTTYRRCLWMSLPRCVFVKDNSDSSQQKADTSSGHANTNTPPIRGYLQLALIPRQHSLQMPDLHRSTTPRQTTLDI